MTVAAIGVVGGLGALACLYIAMPWGAIAGVAVLAATVVTVRRFTRPPFEIRR